MSHPVVEIVEALHGDYLISTDPDRVDIDVVHKYLSEDSYWAAGRGLETQRNAVANSPLVIGLGLQILATRDAHGLYNQVGYESQENPDWWMERRTS